jgi:hypothetical protein
VAETQKGCFVSSFSERGDQLSQWRAYCPGGKGYSLGFRQNNALFLPQNDIASISYVASMTLKDSEHCVDILSIVSCKGRALLQRPLESSSCAAVPNFAFRSARSHLAKLAWGASILLRLGYPPSSPSESRSSSSLLNLDKSSVNGMFRKCASARDGVSSFWLRIIHHE